MLFITLTRYPSLNLIGTYPSMDIKMRLKLICFTEDWSRFNYSPCSVVMRTAVETRLYAVVCGLVAAVISCYSSCGQLVVTPSTPLWNTHSWMLASRVFPRDNANPSWIPFVGFSLVMEMFLQYLYNESRLWSNKTPHRSDSMATKLVLYLIRDTDHSLEGILILRWKLD